MKTKPNNTCPQCGAPLPTDALAGLCPACVMAMNLATPTLINEDGSTARIRFEVPELDEIVPLFQGLEIIELLGQGGMGVVYKARQKELDRIVALKILPKEIGETLGFAERFAREARVLGKLNHPNIVTLHEFGHVDMEDGEPLYYFLMEYVDGLNLRQLLHTGRVEAREALSIVPQICDALQYAHDEGIVHRDIKPENILLDRRGNVKVADFGLAKIVEDEKYVVPPLGGSNAEHESRLKAGLQTLSLPGNVIMGTPKYMSPEQVEAPGEVDHRADIYALGVVFYQMLTGVMPEDKLLPPSQKVTIDVRLDEVVLRALEQKPDLRYQQASVLKTSIETIASDAGVEKSRRNTSQAKLDKMYRDPANWRFYFFYFCGNDPRIIVPKRISGLGWTVNLGNPRSVPFILLLCAVLMGAVHIAGMAGLTGKSMLAVKITLIAGVVWMCHKLSLAREVVCAKTQFRRRCASFGFIVALVIFGIFFMSTNPQPEPKGTHLEQLAENPHKLKKQSVEIIIEAGMTDIQSPWAWNELKRRVDNDEMDPEQVNVLVSSFVDLMARDHPEGYQQPLFSLGELLEKLSDNNLLNEDDKLRVLTHLTGAPSLAPLPRVAAGEEIMGARVHWKSPWDDDLFGYTPLNNLKSICVDGRPVEINRKDPPSRNQNNYSFPVALPRLDVGVHQLECEIDTAFVKKESSAGLDQRVTSADWPAAEIRWMRTCSAEFTVYAEDEIWVELIDDP